MENERQKRKGFIGYEYKEVTAESGKVSFLIDGYASFGWELDGNVMQEGYPKQVERTSYGPQKKAVVRLKRDRKIINKAELTRLQRNFEACASEIEALERSKTSKATAVAIALGILGTAFMAGSVFAVTAQPPLIALCIILAVPAFAGWILPYFLYKNIVKTQTEKITPLIEKKYDEIYEICEKGNGLLH